MYIYIYFIYIYIYYFTIYYNILYYTILYFIIILYYTIFYIIYIYIDYYSSQIDQLAGLGLLIHLQNRLGHPEINPGWPVKHPTMAQTSARVLPIIDPEIASKMPNELYSCWGGQEIVRGWGWSIYIYIDNMYIYIYINPIGLSGDIPLIQLYFRAIY